MIALKPDEVIAFTFGFLGAAVATFVLVARWYRRAH